tara:strand:+ start:84 stop:434 length:351 start_codon:yes stop_codon:yes gene_type:complete
MDEGTVDVYVPTTKYFKVNRLTFRGSKYTGDCSSLAHWYYMNINVYCDNLIIYIHGDFHTTYPNPEHITVEFEDGGIRSQRYHMSVDANGMFYNQNLMGAKKKKKTKKKRKKKKSK